MISVKKLSADQRRKEHTAMSVRAWRKVTSKEISVMKKHLIFVILALVFTSFNFLAAAEQVIVKDSEEQYITKKIEVENVRGVQVRLLKEIIRDDCNRRAISLTQALVSGNGDGWYDKYFLDAGMAQTLKHCPSDKPVKEIIYSEPLFIKSFTNENVKDKVIVFLVIPKEYQLEVVAIR